jgi:hypothetical protein
MSPYIFILTDIITAQQQTIPFHVLDEAMEYTGHHSWPGAAYAALLVETTSGRVIWSSFGTVENARHGSSIKARLKTLLQ